MGDDGAGTVTLYAAVFNNVDSHNDVIVQGAFKNLDAFVADGWGAVNHDNWSGDLGICYIESAEQDAIGLKVVARFHSTPDAQAIRTKVRERMNAGKSVKCSFGYWVLDASDETREGRPITVLKALDIFEFSFVTLAANKQAGVVSAKGMAPIHKLSEVKAMLADFKAGRTVSRGTHAALKAIYDAMAPAVGELKAFCDSYDPDAGDDDSEMESDGVSPGKSDDKARILAKARAELALHSHSPVFNRMRGN